LPVLLPVPLSASLEQEQKCNNKTEDDDGFRNDRKEQAQTEKVLILRACADSGSPDAHLGNTGTKTGETNSKSGSDCLHSNLRCLYHIKSHVNVCHNLILRKSSFHSKGNILPASTFIEFGEEFDVMYPD